MVEIMEKNFVHYSINSDIVDYWTTNLLKRYSMILMTHTIDLLLEEIGLTTHGCTFFIKYYILSCQFFFIKQAETLSKIHDDPKFVSCYVKVEK